MQITSLSDKEQEIFSCQECVCTASVTLLEATLNLLNTKFESGFSKVL